MRNRVKFEYEFDSRERERWIEFDTGWKIILGKGLDLYRSPGGKKKDPKEDEHREIAATSFLTYVRHNFDLVST